MNQNEIFKKTTMSEDEMINFINSIGRSELYDEIKESKLPPVEKALLPVPYPRYLKAIRVSLVALGYDEEWVDTVFRDALEKEYLEK